MIITIAMNVITAANIIIHIIVITIITMIISQVSCWRWVGGFTSQLLFFCQVFATCQSSTHYEYKYFSPGRWEDGPRWREP